MSDHDVGDALDERMPLGSAGIGRVCYSALGMYMAWSIWGRHGIGETGISSDHYYRTFSTRLARTDSEIDRLFILIIKACGFI